MALNSFGAAAVNCTVMVVVTGIVEVVENWVVLFGAAVVSADSVASQRCDDPTVVFSARSWCFYFVFAVAAVPAASVGALYSRHHSLA